MEGHGTGSFRPGRRHVSSLLSAVSGAVFRRASATARGAAEGDGGCRLQTIHVAKNASHAGKVNAATATISPVTPRIYRIRRYQAHQMPAFKATMPQNLAYFDQKRHLFVVF
jgi:hypothetical protein